MQLTRNFISHFYSKVLHQIMSPVLHDYTLEMTSVPYERNVTPLLLQAPGQLLKTDQNFK